MAALRDRVKCSTSTTGTGTITLGAAVPGYRSFASAYSTLATVSYVIEDGTAWETGVGYYNNGAGTLSRDVVDGSSAGGTTKISLTGNATVGVAALSRESVIDWPFLNATYDDTKGPAQGYAGAFGKLFFNTVVTDTHGMMSGSTPDYFTIPQSGVYSFQLNLRLNDAATTQRNYGVGVNNTQSDGPYFSWYTTGLATQGVTRHGAPYFRKRYFAAGTIMYCYTYADGFSPGVGAIDLTVERIR